MSHRFSGEPGDGLDSAETVAHPAITNCCTPADALIRRVLRLALSRTWRACEAVVRVRGAAIDVLIERPDSMPADWEAEMRDHVDPLIFAFAAFVGWAKHAIPAGPCPCGGPHDSPDIPCPICLGAGWITARQRAELDCEARQ